MKLQTEAASQICSVKKVDQFILGLGLQLY